MITPTMDQVRQYIATDFSAAPDIAMACNRIVDYIASQPDEKLQHLTYGMLAMIAKSESKEVVSRVVSYLSGDIARVLEMRFEFIDGDDIYPLDSIYIIEARREGCFIHPDTGFPVDDYESSIYIYFVPTVMQQERHSR